MKYLDRFRTVTRYSTRMEKLMRSLSVLLLGLTAGVVAKWMDISSDLLGTVFSQLSVWVLLGTAIALFSSSPRRAAVNVFLFFAGMVAAYYVAAQLMGGVWSMSFAIGWGIAACLSPIAGYFTWYAGGRGWLPTALSAGILILTVAATGVLFDHMRVSDYIILTLCAALLFGRRLTGR